MNTREFPVLLILHVLWPKWFSSWDWDHRPKEGSIQFAVPNQLSFTCLNFNNNLSNALKFWNKLLGSFELNIGMVHIYFSNFEASSMLCFILQHTLKSIVKTYIHIYIYITFIARSVYRYLHYLPIYYLIMYHLPKPYTSWTMWLHEQVSWSHP